MSGVSVRGGENDPIWVGSAVGVGCAVGDDDAPGGGVDGQHSVGGAVGVALCEGAVVLIGASVEMIGGVGVGLGAGVELPQPMTRAATSAISG